MSNKKLLLILCAAGLLIAIADVTLWLVLTRGQDPSVMASGAAEAVMTTKTKTYDGLWDAKRYSDEFYLPIGIAVKDGNLIVADSLCDRVQIINGEKNKRIGKPGMYGLSYLDSGALIDGYRENTMFMKPSDVALDANGDIIICDTGNHSIRRMDDETVVTIAGNGESGYRNGKESAARFNSPCSATVGADGTIYVADTMNHCIRRIDTKGRVTLYAGTPEASGYRDGTLTEAQFYEPSGLYISPKGDLYIADAANHCIRKISSGTVSTVAGIPGETNSLSGYPDGGYIDGSTTEARFDFPRDVTMLEDGTLIIADTMNHSIRMLRDGEVKTLAGGGLADQYYSSAENLKLSRPEGVCADGDTLYIADTANNRVVSLPLTERILEGRPSRKAMLENTGVSTNSKYAYKGDIRVYIDSRLVDMGRVPPWNTSECIYVPIRPLFEALGAAVGVNEKTDSLVLAATCVMDESSADEWAAEDYILPFFELADASSQGFINVSLDNSDGVIREALTAVKYGDVTVYSLPYEVYRTYCRTMDIEPAENIPLDQFGRFPIDYAAKPGKYTELSLWGLINDEYNPALFKGAIVFIGPYAQGIGDRRFSTPFDHQGSTYGVEINANIVQNLLEGNFKQDAPWYIDAIVMAFLGLILMLLMVKLKPASAAAAMVILAAAQIFGAKIAYAQLDIVLYGGACVVFLLVCYLANLILSILSAQNEKQHIQGLFGRFVSPDVVKEMISGGVSVELGGAVKDVTLLFVDIRGFTTFSEANPPEKVVGMVNRYLTLTSHSIQKNGGTIDKFIGDATMAVFNAPLDLPDHPLCAVKAAWAMKRGSIELREEILRDYGVDLQFGIGVNTGPAVIGNMGSDLRMDYTAIGDTVNTAARLEANATKGQVLISDATYQLVKDHVEVTDLGVLSVKNKKVGIQIYNLENVI